ncbi:hypothetical protein LEP1GSC021_3044 [Leptospira noguchii str. 1993005606]|uniref:Uncharacterized protein n=1 Tax=Leptospira noguchii str. 2007001578 TaxID=1049974 RepID=A0ABP2T3Q7_9LEPT|nr:hypothetical protein LEP1GSC035_4819 [Leptospira noguchii str. 2007001578]EMN00178.1 hypothetical protein LEP1GSC035_2333 [Leptospira noguchii str. 2007001578]EPE86069.1 hypothetical protein LEP1GSC021_3044 [Leptospira noguchii str. 1993005606]
MNAYLWVGVQEVVAPEFIIRPNFLTSNSRYFKIQNRVFQNFCFLVCYSELISESIS